MEGTRIKSRKNEARRLLRASFKNPIFSFVPFEIWRDIVSFADAKTLVTASKTCWGFKELVDDVGERNLNLALLLRNEGQVVPAKKYLLKCAENGNARAMFHLGYASYMSGWRLKQDYVKAAEWFKKAAEGAYGPGMAWFAYSLKYGKGIFSNINLSIEWGRKAVATKNDFASGCCAYWSLGGDGDDVHKAFSHFQASAEEGCEYGQNWLGQFYQSVSEIGIDFKKAKYWYKKSAKQGNCDSQYYLGCLYRDGTASENDQLQDLDKAMILLKKAAKQGNRFAIAYLTAKNKD